MSNKNKNKKSHNTEVLYKYFNVNSVPENVDMVDFLQGMLDRAEEVLAEHGLVMKPWCTFNNYHKQVVDLWYDDVYDHKKWWMDQYVNEVGYMVWNDTFNKYHKEWYRTGVLIDVPELPKRARSNGESVADHFATMAVAKLVEPYL